MSSHCPAAAMLGCSQFPISQATWHLHAFAGCVPYSGNATTPGITSSLKPLLTHIHLRIELGASVDSMVPGTHTYHRTVTVFLCLFNSLRACPLLDHQFLKGRDWVILVFIAPLRSQWFLPKTHSEGGFDVCTGRQTNGWTFLTMPY